MFFFFVNAPRLAEVGVFFGETPLQTIRNNVYAFTHIYMKMQLDEREINNAREEMRDTSGNTSIIVCAGQQIFMKRFWKKRVPRDSKIIPL